MNTDDAHNLDHEVADILMELPQGFDVGSRRYYLYPISLGKSYLLPRLMANLSIDAQQLRANPFAEALRLAIADAEAVCRIIALHTMRTQQECHDTKRLGKIAKYLVEHLSVEEIAQLFALVIAEKDISEVTAHLGIDADNRRRQRVLAAKKNDRNTYTFGGNSVFGAMIAPACEKLHMTPRQVVWDISLKFLRLLIADNITQVHLTDDERKKCRVSNDNDIINGDDPAMQERIKQMKWD